MHLNVAQIIVFTTLAAALLLFITGWMRYDLVAVCALLTLGLAGVVKPEEIFSGFADGAVISVAAVLVMSRGLRNSGMVEALAERLALIGGRLGESPKIALMGTFVSFLSAFINDVGTLALFMPVSIKLARRQNASVGPILMPLAYATLLGGMTTLIGSSVNLVISAYRARVASGGFGMFSYTPVGIGIAIVGLVFVSAVGWRLLPKRSRNREHGELFKIDEYMTEVRVPDKSKAVGQTIGDLEEASEGTVSVLSLLRDGWRQVAPSGFQILRPNDLLIVRGDPESLQDAISKVGLELEAQKQQEEKEQDKNQQNSEKKAPGDAVQMVEAVVVPGARIVGHTASRLRLRDRYAVNILAVSRQGGAIHVRLRDIGFKAGDVLLAQGQPEALQQAFSDLGLLPLADREIRLGQTRRVLLAIAVFAVSLAAATLNLFSVAVCLVSGALAMVLFGLVPPEEIYSSIEWPVLVFIASMISVAGALQTSGVSELLALPLLTLAHHLPDVGAVSMIYVVTMLLANFIHHVAAAVLMAPVAQGIAAGLGMSLDPLLMAVAYGSVSAFITPIGHPSNTLVMGPGGYKFNDYMRMGLPLSILTALTASLLIPLFWPL
ncbi:MAG TPA: SLC13 family permease [Dissulfurispiraceae bacterium]|nr:SLC13 family permease [Dissulfurispiraceae bacterium]